MYADITNEYLGGSDFANSGFWNGNTRDAEAACFNLMEKMLEFISDKTGNILDIACGKGATTRNLLKFYPSSDITAINISGRQLDTARKNAPYGLSCSSQVSYSVEALIFLAFALFAVKPLLDCFFRCFTIWVPPVLCFGFWSNLYITGNPDGFSTFLFNYVQNSGINLLSFDKCGFPLQL